MKLNSRSSKVTPYRGRVASAERLTYFSFQQAGPLVSFKAVATIGHVSDAVKYAPVVNMDGSYLERKRLLMRVALCTFGR